MFLAPGLYVALERFDTQRESLYKQRWLAPAVLINNRVKGTGEKSSIVIGSKGSLSSPATGDILKAHRMFRTFIVYVGVSLGHFFNV